MTKYLRNSNPVATLSYQELPWIDWMLLHSRGGCWRTVCEERTEPRVLKLASLTSISVAIILLASIYLWCHRRHRRQTVDRDVGCSNANDHFRELATTTKNVQLQGGPFASAARRLLSQVNCCRAIKWWLTWPKLTAPNSASSRIWSRGRFYDLWSYVH